MLRNISFVLGVFATGTHGNKTSSKVNLS